MLQSTTLAVKNGVVGCFPHINRFAPPPQRRKLLPRSLLELKQACMCFKAPPRRLKQRCRMFPTYKQVCTSCTGPPQWWKLFLHLFWHLNRPARASQHLLGGENGVIGCVPYINRIAPASQELHSGENCFLHLLWHLNRPACASQHLLCV